MLENILTEETEQTVKPTKKDSVEYESKEDYKKYGGLKFNDKMISLRFNKKDFTNKDLNDILKKDRIDLLDLGSKMEENVNNKLALIYYGSNFYNNKSITLQQFFKAFNSESPAYKVKFVEANEEYLVNVAERMGF